MDMLNNALYIADDKLSAYAASAARLLKCEESGSGRAAAALLRRQAAQIRRTHQALSRRSDRQEELPPACAWVLDNWYMVQREAFYAVGDLAEAKGLRLCQGVPLILELCRSLVRAGQGEISEARCLCYLDGFQSVTVLRRAELQLFPAALRAALIGEIAAVCRCLAYSGDSAPQAKAFEVLFGSLRLLAVADTEKLLRAADVTGAVLSADPSGDYPRMDARTQQLYLQRVEKLAGRAGVEEHRYARRLIRQAKAEGRHVGLYLFPPERQLPAGLYIGANLLLTAFFSLLPAFRFQSLWAALLLLLPVSELVKNLLDALLARLSRPGYMPRMDMEQGVPDDGRTVCVLSSLLTDEDCARAQARRLEELRLLCRREGGNLRFALLADLPAAGLQRLERDEAVFASAREEIEALNRRYGGGFCLLSRERSFDGELWTGWERKRGALLELARLLEEQESALRVTGDDAALAGVKYILTLDSDTRVYPGAVGALIGCMLHPLQRPVIDEQLGVVTRGRAVLQPRMDTDLKSANATDFALVFAGAGGSDPYGGLCGELYMDLFGRSGFAGKGILDAHALLCCSEAHIPEGRVLSHDALEGALLRGGYVGDAAFSDAFPARPLAYFRRLHRWVRGDWQNLPWLFCRIFSPLDRWRLFDNLRRSLMPPMTLLAILAGFFLPGKGLEVSAWAALLALLSSLLRTLAEGALRERPRPRLRRYTRLFTGAGGALVRTFLRLWLLPWEAWVCLSALLTALWRMFISHRRLLQWQTAAQSEQGSGGLGAHLRAMWPCMLLGVFLLWTSPAILGRSAGLLWLLSPLTAAALALPAQREEQLSSADRAYLRAAAGALLGYYRKFCAPEDHGLPPDNFQEQPPVGLAHRTSPTNMGLALASCVAALDMELAPKEEMLSLIRGMLEGMARLPQHLGHFYNWYDTRTLTPLSPAYISTVDSGNLCACLLVLRQALRELGEDALAEKTEMLLTSMDFSPLYDAQRGLFYICYDAQNEKGAGGWYDLLASEAMLTSYLAIAKGDVPEKHWRRLSRAQLQKDGFRGLASWTGTMFEYLMPALFLPFSRGSLLYESGRFCLYAQKRRVGPGRPWGVSESAFASLDARLNYRYKANGVAALALKRGQDEDLVVSPYSSFLALALQPQAALRNLRRMERLGAVGRFGFIEALDFTPERSRRPEGERVQCSMAHHTGMSILAAANALCRESIRRRFLAEPAMAAYRLLLEERLPDTGAVLRRELTHAPERPLRRPESPWRLQGEGADRSERLCLLSNGVYSIMSTNLGETRACCGELSVYGAPYDPGREAGFWAELILRGKTLPLWPCPLPTRWELGQERCAWEVSDETLTVSLSLGAALGELGELRTLRLRPEEDGPAELRLSLEPILARYADYEQHPAYWQLGLCAEERDGALLLRRLPRGVQKELWLCLACDRETGFLYGPGGAAGLARPTVRASVPLELRAGEEPELRVALCLAPDAESALSGARRILESRESGDFVGAASAKLGLSAVQIGEAMALLPQLRQPLSGAAPRWALWPYGLSGDYPLLCCRADAAEALPLLHQFCLLKSCGLDCDLVYLSEQLGEYRQPFRRKIGEALAKFGLEALLGARAGVHFAPLSAEETIRSRAAFVQGEPPRVCRPLPLPRLGEPRDAGQTPSYAARSGEFEFYVNQSLPPRAWQMVLSNGHLSCLVSETGPCGLWLENAREMRLTAPNRTVWDSQGTELLWVSHQGRRVSLFAASDGLPCRVRYRPGWACWEKELDEGRRLRTQLFVLPGQNARVILVQGAEGLALHWDLLPLLGAPDASSLRCTQEEELFRAENPESYLPGTVFWAGSGSPCACRCVYTPPAMHLSLRGEETSLLVCGCGDPAEIKMLCKLKSALAARDRSRLHWAKLLRRIEVSTGDGALDRYLNTWAVYQTLACRLWARGSLYQSGGAYGFRDQLQDAVNLLPIDAALARSRILDCCRHQYVEGDVMHWWHPDPEGGKGVRSRCGDDLLWLVWALCEYVETTGDASLCRVELPYLNSPPLKPTERDRYERAERSEAAASVLFHARDALERCMARGFGPHGLPRMGSGDWNDGLDAVEGESVWLGWFLAHCARRFAALLERLELPGAQRYRDCAAQVGKAANEAWTGSFYRRGYWPDGEALGGDGRIDALPQAWAALCPEAEETRVDRALGAALARLVDREHRLIKLFDPPYTPEERRPGYLVGYGQGFRENGGQYTHGAIWLALACLRRGRSEDALELLRMLLPETHEAAVYQAEPFVLPADVSAAPGCEGLAGWTWYTGSAGWYYRVALRELLGLQLEDGKLYIRPKLADYTARLTGKDGQSIRIEVRSFAVTVNGEAYGGEGLVFAFGEFENNL